MTSGQFVTSEPLLILLRVCITVMTSRLKNDIKYTGFIGDSMSNDVYFMRCNNCDAISEFVNTAKELKEKGIDKQPCQACGSTNRSYDKSTNGTTARLKSKPRSEKKAKSVKKKNGMGGTAMTFMILGALAFIFAPPLGIFLMLLAIFFGIKKK